MGDINNTDLNGMDQEIVRQADISPYQLTSGVISQNYPPTIQQFPQQPNFQMQPFPAQTYTSQQSISFPNEIFGNCLIQQNKSYQYQPPISSNQTSGTFPVAASHGSRGSWTQHEDDLLISAIRQLGTTKWMDIAKFVPSRTSKQCRERWFNCLAPGLKHEPFQPWEDQIILQKQSQMGNRWSMIAKELPGRSPGAVKNRWYAGLRAQQNANSQISNRNINNDLDVISIIPNTDGNGPSDDVNSIPENQ